MSRFHRSAANAAAVAMTAALVGCSGAEKPDPRPSATSPAPVVKLTAPEIRPGHHRIASEGPRRGSWDLGDVQLAKGISWVNVNCVASAGKGQITLTVDTVGKFSIDCPGNEVRINVNQLDLAEGRKGRFHIETTDHVQWIADIQAPD
ncbi:hypothetical protein ACFT25_23410 [Streptomyces hydrogenans]|uniref:hypothetical protein n=1 Tax=Streptomyces hydrogenans TaxID=1873719 RepID=UPI00363CF080